MIGAGKRAAPPLLVPHQLHPAMRADVVEGRDLHVLAAHDDRGHRAHCHVAHDPVAGIGDFARLGDIQPNPAEYLLFQLESFLGRVDIQRNLSGLHDKGVRPAFAEADIKGFRSR